MMMRCFSQLDAFKKPTSVYPTTPRQYHAELSKITRERLYDEMIRDGYLGRKWSIELLQTRNRVDHIVSLPEYATR